MTVQEIVSRVDVTAPAHGSATATQSDTTDLAAPYRSLMVFGAGDVKFRGLDDADDTWTVPSGAVPFLIPVVVKRVWSTGTTATGIKGLK